MFRVARATSTQDLEKRCCREPPCGLAVQAAEAALITLNEHEARQSLEGTNWGKLPEEGAVGVFY